MDQIIVGILQSIKTISYNEYPIDKAISKLKEKYPLWDFYADDVYAAPYANGTYCTKYDYEMWIIFKRKR